MRIRDSFLCLALAIAFFMCLPSSAAAGGTNNFTDAAQQDFEKGSTEEILIKNGKLSLALAEKSLLKEPVDFIWDLAISGETVYAATGNEGKILKISADAVETLYKDDDPEIFCLAVDPKGFLYAGTGPGGKILKIDEQGKAEVISQSSDTYIWDLAVSKAGNLFAAVGGEVGQVIKISKGRKSVLLTGRKSHFLKIVVADDETVYACSADDGVIYRIDPDGTPKILYDAAESEIRALALSPKGDLFFGTSRAEKGPPEAGEVKIIMQLMSKLGQGKGALPPVVAPVQEAPPGKRPQRAENSIYRIGKNGDVVKVFGGKSLTILSAMFSGSDLFFGTGDEGKLFMLDENYDSVQVTKSPNSLILCLAQAPRGDIYFGTGNSGQVVRLGPEVLKEGAFKSRIFDAGFPAQWGKIKWTSTAHEGDAVTFATRSGNVGEPDETWSDWSTAYTDASGSDIKSPPARFLQYRAIMKSTREKSSPVLDSVSIYYLTANQQPRVESITVDGARPKSSKKPPQQKPSPAKARGVKNISWKAKDPEGDKLVYDIYFKGAGEKKWKLLEEDYLKTSFSWNTAAVPDGEYLIKIVARDFPSNPPDRVLSHYKESEHFIIDNTSPVFSNVVVTITEKREIIVSADVSDAASEIQSASYSLDSEDWIEVFPADEIFDSKSEKIIVKTKPVETGEHTLVIKANDASNNIASGKKVVNVK